MTNRTKIINANSLHTVESLRRWACCCFSQPVSRKLATVLEWLTDFLTRAIMESRKVARSKAVASPRCIDLIRGKFLCGVPQGSILGPLLFIIYIMSLVSLNLYMFADDTSIFCSHKNANHLVSIVNNEFAKIIIWFKVNKLSLNLTKT